MRSYKPRLPLLLMTVAVPILAVGACAAGGGEAGSATSTTTGGGNADLMALMPESAEMVASIDLDALRANASTSSWFEQGSQSDNEDLQAFRDRTGIDPARDIHQVVAAAIPVDDPQADAAPVIAATLTYDPAKVQSSLAEAPTMSYGDHTLYRIDDDLWRTSAGSDTGPAETGPEEPALDELAYLVMLDADSVMIGSEMGIKAALDVHSGSASSVRSNARLVELIDSVSTGNQVWMAAVLDSWKRRLDELPTGPGFPVDPSAIEGIEATTMGLRLGDGLDLRVTAFAQNAEDAKMLGDSLRGLVAMGAMMLQQEQPELFEILDRGISVENADRELVIQALLTAQDIEVLQQLAESQSTGSGS